MEYLGGDEGDEDSEVSFEEGDLRAVAVKYELVPGEDSSSWNEKVNVQSTGPQIRDAQPVHGMQPQLQEEIPPPLSTTKSTTTVQLHIQSQLNSQNPKTALQMHQKLQLATK